MNQKQKNTNGQNNFNPITGNNNMQNNIYTSNNNLQTSNNINNVNMNYNNMNENNSTISNNIDMQNNINTMNVDNNTNNNKKDKKRKNKKEEKKENNNIQTEFGKTVEKAKTVKMTRFQYKVKDQEGKIVESYFDAENKLDVESFLLNKGYEIVSIKEDKLSTSLGLAAISISKKMN